MLACRERRIALLGTEAEQVLPTIEPPAETQLSQTPDPVDDQTSPWALLKVGSTVLALDPAEGGWYEAVVLSVSDDSKSLTVGWRDFPREAKLTIGRYGVGVVFKA